MEPPSQEISFMRKTALFAFIAFLLSFCVTPVYAAEIPPLPHAFYGNVLINGEPASIGTQVEARGEGVLTGIGGNPITTTEPGKYGGADPSEPRLIVQEDIAEETIITFYVNGASTGQTAEWHSGETTELNLTIALGGGGGPKGDITPPRISEVCHEGITETAVNI